MKNNSTNNVLIAEFMGIKVFEGINSNNQTYFYYNNIELKDFEALPNYDSDWNWLMPVVDKIYSMNEYYQYKADTISMFFDGGIELTTDIESVYDSVVEFIEWFNNNK